MKYYVQVFNNTPTGLIMSEENLMQLAYSPNQLIGHPVFFEVIRSEKPIFNPTDYKIVSDIPCYIVSDNTVHEIWDVRDMSPEEIADYKESDKKAAMDVIALLERQCNDVLDNYPISDEIQEFLKNYLLNLENLLNKQDLSISDVAEIKMHPYELVKE